MARTRMKRRLRQLRPVWMTVWLAVRGLVRDDGLELSGHLAFTALLALFPFLIFLAALAGFLGDLATGERFVAFMLEFAPSAISETLSPAITKIFATPDSGLLTFSALFILWTASSCIEAMRVALNRAYRVEEARPFWHLRLQSVFFVLITAFALLLLSVTALPGPLLWSFVTHVLKATAAEAVLWEVSRYAIAAGVMTVALLLLHRWLPRTHRKAHELLPGVLVTVLLLLLAAALFSVYLANVASYNVIYGSLGGVVVTLVYLYVNAVTFIFGAEINSAIWRLHHTHH